MKSVKITLGMMLLLTLPVFNQAFGQWASDGSNIHNTNAGNVGIGNWPAGTLLHAAKNIIEPTIRIQNLGNTGGATFQMIDNASGADWKFKATLNGGFKIRDNAYGLDVITVEPSSSANALCINASGYVGLGTTAPVHKLDVNGKVTFSSDNDYTFLYFDLVNAFASGNTGIIYKYDGLYKTWLYWLNSDNLFKISTQSAGDRPDLVILSDGKVGIGTDTPGSSLDIHPGTDYYVQLCRTSSVQRNYFYNRELVASGDGQAAIYAYRMRDARNDGTAYGIGSTNNAIQAFCSYGDIYTFAVTGYNWNDYNRCGGVLGARDDAAYWGALGYKNSGGIGYGGYFSSYTDGAGKSGPAPFIGIGLGAWGDLLGADIHGKLYGVYAEGENYALYTHGDTYKDHLDIHLQDNGTETMTPLYTSVGTSATVQTYGTATLTDGTADIVFDQSFSNTVSALEPIIVTVTPTGNCFGVYLSDVTNTGCKVTEINAGKSSVTVNYIAIGKRAGYENPNLPAEVISSDYTKKLEQGLHADADKETGGMGLYYENGQLLVGMHPSTFRDPGTKTEEEITPVKKTDSSAGSNDSAGSVASDK